MAALPLVDFRLRWRPYELQPSTSGGTRTMKKSDAYLGFMGSAHKVYSYFRRLRDEGVQTGIAFEFDGHTSSTFDAHRLAEWALAQVRTHTGVVQPPASPCEGANERAHESYDARSTVRMRKTA